MFFFFFFNFESDVKRLIESKLSGSEEIVYDARLGGTIFDLFLPGGCHELAFPPKTAIEIKTKLVSGTVSEVSRQAQIAIKSGDVQHVALIYQERGDQKAWSRKWLQFVSVVSLMELKRRAGIVDDSASTRDSSLFEFEGSSEKERSNLFDRARERFKQGNISLFLGSGVGRSVGLPDWDGLIRRMVGEYNTDRDVDDAYNYDLLASDSDRSTIVMARYLKNSLADKTEDYVPILKRALYRNYPSIDQEGALTLVDAVKLLAVHPSVRRVITYNYDDLLEQAIGDERPYSSIDGRNRPSPGALPIYHIHGFVPQEDDSSYEKNVVFSEDDYHLLYKESFHWSNTEQIHALRNSTCFFIGLSLKDPNLRRLLDIANDVGTGDPPHFAFLEKGEYKQPGKAERLFYSMGVNVLWFKDRNELPRMVKRIVL